MHEAKVDQPKLFLIANPWLERQADDLNVSEFQFNV